jgi:hypothetical protein
VPEPLGLLTRLRDSRALLLVSLDDARRPFSSSISVVPGFAESPPLSKQVPGLVQSDLQLPQPLPIGVGPLTGSLPLPELVLLGDQPLDLGVDLSVVHKSPSLEPERKVVDVHQLQSSAGAVEQPPEIPLAHSRRIFPNRSHRKTHRAAYAFGDISIARQEPWSLQN